MNTKMSENTTYGAVNDPLKNIIRSRTHNLYTLQSTYCKAVLRIRDPRWVKYQDPDEEPGSYFRELRHNFLG
jgi:hypothetical protein